ncbi:ISAs1 family transposase [Gordonia sp. NPDC003424]
MPSESTIRRTLERLDGDDFDRVVNTWMMLAFNASDGRRIVAADGKTLRGSVDDAGDRPHLLAAMDHASTAVIGQVAVGAKTNEIPKLIDLLDPIDITDALITLDALHTQRATADYIVRPG